MQFTSNNSQNIEMLICYYKTCARQQRLPRGQKLASFSVVLEGRALTFFLKIHVPDKTYEEIAEAMKCEYSSNYRRL